MRRNHFVLALGASAVILFSCASDSFAGHRHRNRNRGGCGQSYAAPVSNWSSYPMSYSEPIYTSSSSGCGCDSGFSGSYMGGSGAPPVPGMQGGNMNSNQWSPSNGGSTGLPNSNGTYNNGPYNNGQYNNGQNNNGVNQGGAGVQQNSSGRIQANGNLGTQSNVNGGQLGSGQAGGSGSVGGALQGNANTGANTGSNVGGGVGAGADAGVQSNNPLK